MQLPLNDLGGQDVWKFHILKDFQVNRATTAEQIELVLEWATLSKWGGYIITVGLSPKTHMGTSRVNTGDTVFICIKRNGHCHNVTVETFWWHLVSDLLIADK